MIKFKKQARVGDLGKVLTCLMLSLTFGFCHFASADEAQIKRFLVSLQDFNSHADLKLTSICSPLQGPDLLTMQSGPEIECLQVSEFDFNAQAVQKKKFATSFDFHIELIKERGNNKLVVNTHFLRPQDELDFSSVQNFYFGSVEELTERVQNHIRQVENYSLYGDSIKVSLLKQTLLAQAGSMTELKKTLIDPTKNNGIAELTWRQAIKKISFGNTNSKSVARAYLQIAVALSFASYIYWDNVEANREDFDYDSFDKKIKDTVLSTRGWNLDTNTELFNTGHALAGVVYYQAARNNGFSALASFAITNLSSLWWEIFGEHKESASIGDQFITGIGGAILGEAFYQVAKLARKKSNSILSRIVRGTLDPLGLLNRHLDKFGDRRRTEFAGMTDEDFNRIETTLAKSVNGQEGYKFGLMGDVLNIENYGAPGIETGIMVDLAAASVLIEATKNKLNGSDLRVLTQVAWLSYYKKKINQKSEGYAALLSVGGEVDYVNQNSEFKDYHLNVSMFGPQIRLDGFIRGIRIRVEAAVYADFVMIKSLALPEFDSAPSRTREGLQSHVRKQGHHFAFGATQKLRLALSYRDWTGYVGIRQFQAHSIEGQDRFQSQVTQGDKYVDKKSRSEVGLRYDISSSAAVSLRRENINRRGTMSVSSGSPNSFVTTKESSRTWIEFHHKW